MSPSFRDLPTGVVSPALPRGGLECPPSVGICAHLRNRRFISFILIPQGFDHDHDHDHDQD